MTSATADARPRGVGEVRGPVAMDGARSRFLIAALFVESTPERRVALQAIAEEVGDWGGVVETAERHGVLGLVARNVRDSDAPLPDDVRTLLEERSEAMREDAQRFRFTLSRFVRAATERGIVPTLLKGASLTLDLYSDPSWRGQGDIDLLVEPDEISGALRIGAAAGVMPGVGALPVWWYRRAHFHVKLLPSSALLREVEVHWALQHPSLLLTPNLDAMKARRVESDVDGARVLVLDRVDRFLHLTTHLVSHARGVPGSADAGTLARLVEDVRHPLRLKWVVDLHVELERWGADLPIEELAVRAREWGCEGELRWTVEWVRNALGLPPEADSSAARLMKAAGPRTPREVGVRAQADGPMDAFDFRGDALSRLPRWFWPPAEYLDRRYGDRSLRRARHALGVAARVLTTCALLPVALVGRWMLAARRRANLDAAQEPDAVLELAVAWRKFTRRR